MYLIDSHCHIHDEDFPIETDQVLLNARSNSVTKVICIGVDLQDSIRALEFAKNNSSPDNQLFASVGIHPHEASTFTQDTIAELKKLAADELVVAIGEIGLDYHYNNIVQSAGAIELTGKSSLEGTKEKGIDDYTGTYTADYEDFSDTEYLFGGTSIKREAGKELSIDCTLEVTEGTAKVFWISGSDEAVTLIETTGTYSDTITLPDGGNYIGIECESFTGSIELNIE